MPCHKQFTNQVTWSILEIQSLQFYYREQQRLYTKLYDKHDDFDFHIVNFPFLSSNIPSSPSYGVCIVHIMMTLDIGINFWLTYSYLRAMKLNA